MTPDEIDAAVGRNLGALGLFPDTDLFVEDRGVRTRSFRNVRVSELRQPTGASITDDELFVRIDGTQFDEDLLARHHLDSADLRERMRAVVQGGGTSARREVDLALWLELFERRADQAGLGQTIRENLAATSPDRVDEYETLDVEAGLDHSEQEAAERLIRAEPPEGLPALIDILAARLRRRVEKVAFPDAQIAADPLRALLHALHVLDDIESPIVRLGLERASEGAEWSQWLFAFLYGRTLLEVAERASDGPRQLEIDPKLVNVERPEFPAEDEEFDVSKAWASLRLVIDVVGIGARRFRWDPQGQPGLVGFAALIQLAEPIRGTQVLSDLDTFCERFLTRATGVHSLHHRLHVARQPSPLRRSAARCSGICATASPRTRSMTTSRPGRRRRTRLETRSFPRTQPLQELADVVLTDVIELADGHLALLAVHPLRLACGSRVIYDA